MASKEVLKIAGLKLTVDGAAQFQSSLKNINSQMKISSAELQKVTAQYGKNSTATGALAAKKKALEDKLKTQRDATARLNDVLKETEKRYGENSTEANTMRGKVLESEAAEKRLERQLKEVSLELAKQASKAVQLGQKLQTAGDKMKTVGDKMKTLGSNMSKFVTLPILAAGAGLFKLGESFDDAVDKIRIGTGATGDALKGLEDDFEAVYATVPSSMEDVSTAIADLNTRLGLNGKPLQDMAEQMLNLARLTNTDVKTAIEAATRMFNDAGITQEDYADALDYTFRVSQSTGIGIDRLQQLMTKFGGPLRQMGFSWQEAAAMLGKFEKEGVNTELVVGSLRIALGKMAKEGIKDPPKALAEITKRIKDAGSAGEANAIALETFGARAGPDMAAAIREGRLDFDELLTSLKNGEDTINGAAKDTEDFAEKFQLLKNKLALALKPLAGEFMKTLEDLIPTFVDVVKGVGDLIKGFNKLSPETKKMIIMGFGLAAALGPVVCVAGSLTSGIGSLVKGAGSLIEKFGASRIASATATTGLGNVAGAASGATGAASKLTSVLGKAGLVGAIGATVLGLASLIIGVGETQTEVDELVKSVEESYERFKDNETAMDTNAILAGELSDELFDLADKEKKTNTEKARMKQLVNQLNELIPDLGLEIDSVTGKLNKQRDAIKGVIEEKMNEIRLAAYEERLLELYKERIEIEDKLNGLLQVRQDYTQSNAAAGSDYQAKVESLNGMINELSASLELNNGETQRLEGAYSDLATRASITGNATGGAAAAIADAWTKADQKTRTSMLNQINEQARSGSKLTSDSRVIVNGIIASYGKMEGGLKTVGKDAMIALGRAIINEKSPKEASKASKQDCIDAFIKAYGEFESAGEGTMDAATTGIKNSASSDKNTAKVEDASLGMKRTFLGGFSGFTTNMNTVATNGVTGFINGILSRWAQNKTENAAHTFGSWYTNSLAGYLVEQSPSKVTEKIGKYASEGFINGILGEEQRVMSAAKHMGQTYVGGLAGNVGGTPGAAQTSTSIPTNIENVIQRGIKEAMSNVTVQLDRRQIGRLVVMAER